MAGISTIDRNSTTSTIRDEFLYTWCRLQEHPLTQAVGEQFGALWPAIKAISEQDEDLSIRVLRASAALEFSDISLDYLAEKLAGYTQYDSQARKLYFKGKSPSLLKRPIGGTQLEHMADWPAALAVDPNPDRNALTQPIQQAVERAKIAEANDAAVANEYRLFRNSGARAQLVDKLNAARIEAYSQVRQIFIDQGKAHGLPSGWPESFFHSSRARRREPTMEQMDEQIASLEAEANRLRLQQDAVRAALEAADAIRLEAERTAKQARLEAKLKQRAMLEAEMAKLQAELDEETEHKE